MNKKQRDDIFCYEMIRNLIDTENKEEKTPMIEVGNVVTLQDGREYLILEETFVGVIRFVYTVKVDENDIPTDEYAVFEALQIDSEDFLYSISDKELYSKLEALFKKIIRNNFEQGVYNEYPDEIIHIMLKYIS